MANASDRINQLQQYMDWFNKQPGFVRPQQPGQFDDPYQAVRFATAQMDQQNQQMPDVFGGNNMVQLGQQAPRNPQYKQPQDSSFQQQGNSTSQEYNPYSARAMQLNNNPYSGLGDGGAASNSLAQMFRNGNYKAGG